MVIKNLSDFLSVLVQTFNLPALFPSTIFVFFLNIFVFPALPHDTLIYSHLHKLDHTSLIILGGIIVIFLTYILDGANLKIIQFFEGYNFLDQVPFEWLRRCNQVQVKQILEDINSTKEKYHQHLKQAKEESDEDKKNEQYRLARHYSDEIYILSSQITDKYPETLDSVLPFKLGNVIAAAEEYPYKLFGMDAIVLWPFLRQIISDKNYAQFYVKDKAILDFILNMIIVLLCFGVLFLFVELLYHRFNILLIIKVGSILLVCYYLLKLAIQSAMSWGTTVRVAFIIFKEDLRKSLQLIEVDDYTQEKQLWSNASEFFGAQHTEDERLKLGKDIFTKNKDNDFEN